MLKRLMNNRGCFGGSQKTKAVPAPPAPAPAPSIIAPSEVESKQTDEERRQKLARMRSGMASTIKSGARGITGSGADLLQQVMQGKEKLGT